MDRRHVMSLLGIYTSSQASSSSSTGSFTIHNIHILWRRLYEEVSHDFKINGLYASYLDNPFESFVTFLICSCFLKVFADPNIFSEENFSVFFQPVKNLNDCKCIQVLSCFCSSLTCLTSSWKSLSARRWCSLIFLACHLDSSWRWWARISWMTERTWLAPSW